VKYEMVFVTSAVFNCFHRSQFFFFFNETLFVYKNISILYCTTTNLLILQYEVCKIPCSLLLTNLPLCVVGNVLAVLLVSSYELITCRGVPY